MTSPEKRFAPEGAAVPHPQVRVSGVAARPRAVALLLHGGRETSDEIMRWRHLPVIRMVPFERALRARLGAAGLVVWRVRFALRGWNGDAAHPAADARWVLSEVRRRHGDLPVVIVGHSMGGRTAVSVADDDAVRGVVGLAPWFPVGEPVEPITGKPVVVAHGLRDSWVPASLSRSWCARARAVTDVQRIELRNADHPMVRRAGLWHALTTYSVARLLPELGVTDVPGVPPALVDAGPADWVTV